MFMKSRPEVITDGSWMNLQYVDFGKSSQRIQTVAWQTAGVITRQNSRQLTQMVRLRKVLTNTRQIFPACKSSTILRSIDAQLKPLFANSTFLDHFRCATIF
jgi:hypothetical protein